MNHRSRTLLISAIAVLLLTPISSSSAAWHVNSSGQQSTTKSVATAKVAFANWKALAALSVKADKVVQTAKGKQRAAALKEAKSAASAEHKAMAIAIKTLGTVLASNAASKSLVIKYLPVRENLNSAEKAFEGAKIAFDHANKILNTPNSGSFQIDLGPLQTALDAAQAIADTSQIALFDAQGALGANPDNADLIAAEAKANDDLSSAVDTLNTAQDAFDAAQVPGAAQAAVDVAQKNVDEATDALAEDPNNVDLANKAIKANEALNVAEDALSTEKAAAESTKATLDEARTALNKASAEEKQAMVTASTDPISKLVIAEINLMAPPSSGSLFG